MSITVTIPASLRKKWQNVQEQVSCEGETIAECIEHLDRAFPGFKETMLDENGTLVKKTIMIFLGGQNIHNLHGLSTPVKDKDEISIIPFMAGG